MKSIDLSENWGSLGQIRPDLPLEPTERTRFPAVLVRDAGNSDAMNLKQHESRDDMNVWLSQNKAEQLLEGADGAQQRIAFALGVRCGLRSHEVLDVAPEDIVDTDAGAILRV